MQRRVCGAVEIVIGTGNRYSIAIGDVSLVMGSQAGQIQRRDKCASIVLEQGHTTSIIIGWVLVESIAVASRCNLLLLCDNEVRTELVTAIDLVDRPVGRIKRGHRPRSATVRASEGDQTGRPRPSGFLARSNDDCVGGSTVRNRTDCGLADIVRATANTHKMRRPVSGAVAAGVLKPIHPRRGRPDDIGAGTAVDRDQSNRVANAVAAGVEERIGNDLPIVEAVLLRDERLPRAVIRSAAHDIRFTVAVGIQHMHIVASSVRVDHAHRPRLSRIATPIEGVVIPDQLPRPRCDNPRIRVPRIEEGNCALVKSARRINHRPCPWTR